SGSTRPTRAICAVTSATSIRPSSSPYGGGSRRVTIRARVEQGGRLPGVEDDGTPTTPLPRPSGDGDRDVVGEARWPMVAAVVAAIVLTLLLPDDLRLGPNWALPVLEAALLVVLIVGDPGSITRRSR